MYYVYALYNKESQKIYIGQTTDLVKRLAQHNEGMTGSYTSRFKGRWFVVYSEEVKDQRSSRVREKQLKSYRGREFVKKYIPL